MLSDAKYIFILFFAFFFSTANAKEIKILIIGQSISSNCNKHLYTQVNGIFQITKDGSIKPAIDPFEWADCVQGSMWIPLGEKIIQAGLSDKVTFMPIGVAGTSVNDWLEGGRAHKKLSEALALVKNKSIKFDYVFWHQGSSDANTPSKTYGNKLNSILKKIRIEFRPEKILIAQHSRCGDLKNAEIAKEQLRISRNHLRHFYEGPDTNALGNEFRFDGCHLNQLGQEKMAELWLESIIKADKIQLTYDREILTEYFR